MCQHTPIVAGLWWIKRPGVFSSRAPVCFPPIRQPHDFGESLAHIVRLEDGVSPEDGRGLEAHYPHGDVVWDAGAGEASCRGASENVQHFGPSIGPDDTSPFTRPLPCDIHPLDRLPLPMEHVGDDLAGDPFDLAGVLTLFPECGDEFEPAGAQLFAGRRPAFFRWLSYISASIKAIALSLYAACVAIRNLI